jgi:hypothetical protein
MDGGLFHSRPHAVLLYLSLPNGIIHEDRTGRIYRAGKSQ